MKIEILKTYSLTSVGCVVYHLKREVIPFSSGLFPHEKLQTELKFEF